MPAPAPKVVLLAEALSKIQLRQRCPLYMGRLAAYREIFTYDFYISHFSRILKVDRIPPLEGCAFHTTYYLASAASRDTRAAARSALAAPDIAY